MIRKITFALLLSTIMTGLTAQNASTTENGQVISKKGKVVLPVTGEFGIGLNALPFIDLFGELIKINSSNRFVNPLSFEAPNGQQLFLKYLKNPSTAYRIRIGLAYHYNTESFPVEDDLNQGLLLADKRIDTYTIITTSLGAEKRKGQGRIQGIFGVELNLLYQHGDNNTMNYKYVYANEITSSNPAPTTALFLDGTPRPLFEKTYASLGIGATGFFGLEYFIAPKISVGGEMGIRAMYINNTASKTRTEEWDYMAGVVEKRQINIDEGGRFDFSVAFNANGVLFLMFYF